MSGWEEHIPLARYIAWRICRVHDACMEHLDDAQQAAVIALWRCSLKYDPSYGVPLPQFAGPYMRGAAKDALRAVGFYDRSVHRRPVLMSLDFVLSPRGRLRQEGGEETFADLLVADDDQERDYQITELLDLCQHRDPRRREIFERFYIQGESLADIGTSFGIGEARACQLLRHAESIVRKKVWSR